MRIAVVMVVMVPPDLFMLLCILQIMLVQMMMQVVTVSMRLDL